jgi:endonuclease YncB( thermonuclease family)
VVDGDTVHVEGLDASLRLLGVDAEETFKHEKDRRAFKAPWPEYMRNMRAGNPRPVKYPTPVGEEAKAFAQRFFEGVDQVRLERDHPREIRDYFNRYLAYVLVSRGGRELNYNLELVRAGLSPYFSKYGYSRRFHAEFAAAEAEARAARRGIWDPAKQHYPDYDERQRWWDARAEFIKAFETDAGGRADHVILTNEDAPERLEALLGREVVVLGAVAAIREAEGNGPARVMLSRRRADDFPLIFWDGSVLARSGLGERLGEYVRVRGVVSRYEDRRGRSQLQIVIQAPGQIAAARDAGARAR